MKRWDIFCKIVDNFGDIGVCWRLARQLQAEHGLQVRLWIDDLSAAKQLIPDLDLTQKTQIIQNITIASWQANTVFDEAAATVIEAFSCELPPNYLAEMHAATVWVNLEYLSAETWVDDFHARNSKRGNLTRHFFFPGFTPATGGLLREHDLVKNNQELAGSKLLQRQFLQDLNAKDNVRDPRETLICLSHRRDRKGYHHRIYLLKQIILREKPVSSVLISLDSGFRRNDVYGINQCFPRLKISLFCYPHAPIAALLNAMADSDHPIDCFVPASNILSKVAHFFGKNTITTEDVLVSKNLHLHVLPFLSQPNYDKLLASCDINFVRGEDSWVRAIWAGRPFIWQPYWQTEDTHIVKLHAFLNLFYSDCAESSKKSACEMHAAWVADNMSNATWQAYLNNLTSLNAWSLQQSNALAAQADLATKLVIFCENSHKNQV